MKDAITKSDKTVKSGLVMIILTLGSKFLGFIREILIATKFGSGMETDAFFVALTATSLATRFITNAISTTTIPVLTEIESKEGKKGKLTHTNNMINIILVVSIVLVLLGLILAPFIIKLLASGFKEGQYNLAVKLTRIGLPMILFSGAIGIFTGYLQSSHKFISTSAVGIPFNIIYISFLLLFADKFGIEGLMVSAVLAVASQLLIQVPEIKNTGYKYRFKLDLKDEYFNKIISLCIPVFIGVAINDLNAIIDRTLASSLISGSISALNYADKLNGLILSVFISAIATVIFPLLSKEANSGNIDGVKNSMKYGVNLILLITVPATVGLIVLAKPIVEVSFQRGEFDSIATLMTSRALMAYSAGLVFMALRLLITRVYFSLQDTKTPMINGIIGIGFNIILNIVLIKYMGHVGLALATSISTTIATIFMFLGLKKILGQIGLSINIKCGLKSVLASIIMGIVAYVTYHSLYKILGVSKIYNLISLLIAVGLAVIVYVIICYLLGIEEIKYLIYKVKDIFDKFKDRIK